MNRILIDKDDLTTFEVAAKTSSPYLKRIGITLNFLGYNDFLKKYFNVEEEDIESIYELTKESIFWGNYLSEIKNLTNAYSLNKIIEKENRKIKGADNEIKAIRLFLRHLEIQIRYCNLIHSETLKLYRRNMFKIAFRSSN